MVDVVGDDQNKDAPPPEAHPEALKQQGSPAMVHTDNWQRDDDDDDDEYSNSNSFEDPYTYSDDSLSDAYFFPQADGDNNERRRYHHANEHDPLQGGTRSTYPMASYYGSLSNNNNGNNNNNNSNGQQHNNNNNGNNNNDHDDPPLWVAGAIQEDAELDASTPHLPPHTQRTHSHNQQHYYQRHPQRHHHHRHYYNKQQQQQHHYKKKKQRAARERAVARIRGQPQPDQVWRDVPYAVLFVLQFCCIVACAVWFGYGLLQAQQQQQQQQPPKTTSASSSAFHMFSRRNFPWQRQQQQQQPRTALAGGDLVPPNLVASRVQSEDTTTTTYHDDDVVFLPQKNSSSVLFLNDTTTASSDKVAVSSSSSSYYYYDFAFTIDYKNVIALVGVTGFYACILTYLSFGFMLILSRALIQIMLVFSVLLALAWGLIGLTLLDPYGVIALMGFGALLATLGYTFSSWNRIPFAATNLYTALCAMRCTADITVLGLLSLLVAFGWCVIWTMAFVGLVNSFNSAECTKKKENACEPHVTTGHIPLYLLLLFSFHWTNSVIKNVVRATVAGAVGTWWFHPDHVGPFCTSAVLRPLLRSLTKSLGSICYGSLVVQPVQMFAGFAQCCCCLFGCNCGSQDGSSSSGSCLNPPKMGGKKADVVTVVGGADSEPEEEQESAAESVCWCRNSCVPQNRCRSFLRSCNRWSFTYIGMCKFFSVLGFKENANFTKLDTHLFCLVSAPKQTAMALSRPENVHYSYSKRVNG